MHTRITNTDGWSIAGGTLLSIAVTLDGGDLLKSIVLAAIGTAVSYAVTRGMKALFERQQK